eukprot:scaffold12.g8224.t1
MPVGKCSIGEDGHLDVCSACGNGGELLCCDHCPGAYHPECCGYAGFDEIPGYRSGSDWRCWICLGKSAPRTFAHPTSKLTVKKGDAVMVAYDPKQTGYPSSVYYKAKATSVWRGRTVTIQYVAPFADTPPETYALDDRRLWHGTLKASAWAVEGGTWDVVARTSVIDYTKVPRIAAMHKDALPATDTTEAAMRQQQQQQQQREVAATKGTPNSQQPAAEGGPSSQQPAAEGTPSSGAPSGRKHKAEGPPAGEPPPPQAQHRRAAGGGAAAADSGDRPAKKARRGSASPAPPPAPLPQAEGWAPPAAGAAAGAAGNSQIPLLLTAKQQQQEQDDGSTQQPGTATVMGSAGAGEGPSPPPATKRRRSPGVAAAPGAAVPSESPLPAGAKEQQQQRQDSGAAGAAGRGAAPLPAAAAQQQEQQQQQAGPGGTPGAAANGAGVRSAMADQEQKEKEERRQKKKRKEQTEDQQPPGVAAASGAAAAPPAGGSKAAASPAASQGSDEELDIMEGGPASPFAALRVAAPRSPAPAAGAARPAAPATAPQAEPRQGEEQAAAASHPAPPAATAAGAAAAPGALDRLRAVAAHELGAAAVAAVAAAGRGRDRARLVPQPLQEAIYAHLQREVPGVEADPQLLKTRGKEVLNRVVALFPPGCGVDRKALRARRRQAEAAAAAAAATAAQRLAGELQRRAASAAAAATAQAPSRGGPYSGGFDFPGDAGAERQPQRRPAPQQPPSLSQHAQPQRPRQAAPQHQKQAAPPQPPARAAASQPAAAQPGAGGGAASRPARDEAAGPPPPPRKPAEQDATGSRLDSETMPSPSFTPGTSVGRGEDMAAAEMLAALHSLPTRSSAPRSAASDSEEEEGEGEESEEEEEEEEEEGVGSEPTHRRPKQRWLASEEEALVKGVHALGAQWQDIKALFPSQLQHRTTAGLKDKWRSLKKARRLARIEEKGSAARGQSLAVPSRNARPPAATDVGAAVPLPAALAPPAQQPPPRAAHEWPSVGWLNRAAAAAAAAQAAGAHFASGWEEVLPPPPDDVPVPGVMAPTGVAAALRCGEEVEVRAVQDDFRGGWFRAKIWEKAPAPLALGGWSFRVSYVEYPDEPDEWVSLLHRTPEGHAFPRLRRPHVLRAPPAPRLAWRKGDMVEAYWSGSDGAHNVWWQGRVALVAGDRVWVAFDPMPLGEGDLRSYPVDHIRPPHPFTPHLFGLLQPPKEFVPRWQMERAIHGFGTSARH